MVMRWSVTDLRVLLLLLTLLDDDDDDSGEVSDCDLHTGEPGSSSRP